MAHPLDPEDAEMQAETVPTSKADQQLDSLQSLSEAQQAGMHKSRVEPHQRQDQGGARQQQHQTVLEPGEEEEAGQLRSSPAQGRWPAR